MDVPSNRTSPCSYRYKRLRQLNRVVFPAPLGPMRPEIPPFGTSKVTALRATMPPNRTVTSRTLSRGPCVTQLSPGAKHLNFLNVPKSIECEIVGYDERQSSKTGCIRRTVNDERLCACNRGDIFAAHHNWLPGGELDAGDKTSGVRKAGQRRVASV